MPVPRPTAPAPSLSRRLYRRLYWAPVDARYWRELRRIDQLIYLGGGGIGDSLNCSAVVYEMRRRSSRRVAMMTPHPELFVGNPEASSIHPYDHQLVTALARWSHPVFHPVYELPQHQPPAAPLLGDHLIAQLCRSVGITGEVSLRPYFHFRPGERERQATFRDAVVVQSSCLHARHVLPAKNWSAASMQTVVDQLRRHYRVVQTGHRDDEPLCGAEDLRGILGLRDLAALLAQARFFVGLVGFLMHLARAVETRAIIVYGGREHPLQSGYVANENLVGTSACAPCGINGVCPVPGHPCMAQLSPEHVFAAVTRLESRLGAPLETARAIL